MCHLGKIFLSIRDVLLQERAMGRGTYSGGSSTIRVREDGTTWGSSDSAENKKQRVPIWRSHGRRPTEKEIELEQQREDSQERKILRSFISECVTAYAAKLLTATHPIAPRSLQKRIKNAGGNIRWLEANSRHQALFHGIYCRILKKSI
jgi:hypothetical protein